jgi:hypothetical protein
MFFIIIIYMRKTKQYRRKNKSRNTRRRRNTKRRTMKGGTTLPFTFIGDAFNSLKYELSNGVNIATVPPSNVPPNKVGGENPLPFKQSGPTHDISDFNYKIN